MDDIDISLNSVKTECGHCFHTSCLMRNVAHNGFGCPYCRTILAEKLSSDEDNDEDDWEDEEDELYDDYALRGLRLFFNNVYGMEQEEEDIIEEKEEEEQEEVEQEEEVPIVKPSPKFITSKLMEKGITMEQLVKGYLFNNHNEYIDNEEEFYKVNAEIYGKIRSIISNYHPSQEQTLVIIDLQLNGQLSLKEEVNKINISQEVDNSAQPKSIINHINLRRRLEIL